MTDDEILSSLRILATGGMNITVIKDAIELIERLTQWQTEMMAVLQRVSFGMTVEDSQLLDDLRMQAER